MSLKVKGEVHQYCHQIVSSTRALTAPNHIVSANDARDTPKMITDQASPRLSDKSVTHTLDVDGFVVRRGLNGHGESRDTGTGTHAAYVRGATEESKFHTSHVLPVACTILED